MWLERKFMVQEAEIYIRLGLKNKADLLSSLSIKNKYNLEWNKFGIRLDDRFKLENKKIIKGYFFDIYPLKNSNLKKKIFQTFHQINRLKVRKGWSISLPNGIVNVPQNSTKAQYSNKEYYLDNGHLLAREFVEYITVKRETNFFNHSDKNPGIYNIIPEFDTTNRSYRKIDGQARFEKYIIDIVRDISNSDSRYDEKIYYEAEAIYHNQADTIPIGVRLFACIYKIYGKKDIGQIKKLFHVFLPNIHVEKDKDSLPIIIREKHPEFIELNDRELYRKFFMSTFYQDK